MFLPKAKMFWMPTHPPPLPLPHRVIASRVRSGNLTHIRPIIFFFLGIYSWDQALQAIQCWGLELSICETQERQRKVGCVEGRIKQVNREREPTGPREKRIVEGQGASLAVGAPSTSRYRA